MSSYNIDSSKISKISRLRVCKIFNWVLGSEENFAIEKNFFECESLRKVCTNKIGGDLCERPAVVFTIRLYFFVVFFSLGVNKSTKKT